MIDKILDARLNSRSGRQEYLVRWKDDTEDDSWEPESGLGNATEAIAAFVAQRESDAQAASASAASEKEAALQAKQQTLRKEWAAAVPIAPVKERFELLDLDGVRVTCPPTADAATLAELEGEWIV